MVISRRTGYRRRSLTVDAVSSMLQFISNRIRALFSRPPVTPARRESDGTQWCLTGNVARETKVGPGAKDARHGSKHFSAGTKVFCLPAQWGDGYEQITVIGRHRGSKQFVTMVIGSKFVTDWRANVVYDPEVLRRIAEFAAVHGHGNWLSKEQVEAYVDHMVKRQAQQKASEIG